MYNVFSSWSTEYDQLKINKYTNLNTEHQHYYVLLKTKWFIKTVILAIWVYILLSLTHNCWILILKSIPDNRQQIS